jgi:pimeloyl-ACP methyl ester carboxylesterase
MTLMRYIFVPGINNYAGSPYAWTDRAVTAINKRMTCDAAEKFEYTAFPLSRLVLAERRARALAELIDSYPIDSFALVVVGHSNGADLIRRALLRSKRPANFVHFLSPAVHATRHGLVKLIRDGQIGFLRIYLATRDRILPRRFLGRQEVDSVRRQFAEEHHTEIFSEPFGHSGWFTPARFATTMRQICGDPPERNAP